MYDLCPVKAYEIAKTELPKVAELGFSGLHYIDVMSVVPPRRCYDKNHPATEKDTEDLYAKIGELSHDLFGGFASEGAYDFADVHLNAVNEQDFGNEEVMYTKECRHWNADGASVKALVRAMDYAQEQGFDQTVICGDVLDYLSYGAMELMDRYIWNRDPNVMVSLGGHELTRQMQTGKPDQTPLSERLEVLERFWRHNMYYLSRVIGDAVMLIQMDNSRHCYTEEIAKLLKRDLAMARKEEYIVLIFQHEPISAGKKEDEKVQALIVCDGEYQNIYDHAIGDFDTADAPTREVYRLLVKNADVVKGIFCGHLHSGYYTEILGSDPEGRQIMIPQYVEEGLVYNDYAGHVLEITIV